MSYFYRDYGRDDPASDWDDYCTSRERLMSKRPKCTRCGCHIEEDYIYRLETEALCDECAKEWLEEQRERINENE